MTRKKKHEPLVVGQRIWIESRWYDRKSTIHEYEIVEANRNSAYAVLVEDLNKEKRYRERIDQRTRAIKTSGVLWGNSSYLWETKEAFEEQVKRIHEMAILRNNAVEKVRRMSYSQLKEFIES